jgi:hypothetical protein
MSDNKYTHRVFFRILHLLSSLQITRSTVLKQGKRKNEEEISYHIKVFFYHLGKRQTIKQKVIFLFTQCARSQHATEPKKE